MHFTGIEGTAPVNSQEGFSSWVNICPPVVDKEKKWKILHVQNHRRMIFHDFWLKTVEYPLYPLSG
jgi:hypothetical protein